MFAVSTIYNSFIQVEADQASLLFSWGEEAYSQCLYYLLTDTVSSTHWQNRLG